MPRDPRFGPKCRELIDEHGLIDLFQTDTGERPQGQLFKPAPTPEDVTEKLTEFLEDLFDAFAALPEPSPPAEPNTP